MNTRSAFASIASSLELVAQERPVNLAERLAPIQRELTAHRDSLRSEQRAGGNSEVRSALVTVNQALSLLHAAAYPSAAIDWNNLTSAVELLTRETSEQS